MPPSGGSVRPRQHLSPQSRQRQLARVGRIGYPPLRGFMQHRFLWHRCSGSSLPGRGRVGRRTRFADTSAPAAEGGNASGNRHREVVQPREGVRLHHPVRRPRRVRALLRYHRGGLQEPRGGAGGRVRHRRRTEGAPSPERPARRNPEPKNGRGGARSAPPLPFPPITPAGRSGGRRASLRSARSRR